MTLIAWFDAAAGCADTPSHSPDIYVSKELAGMRQLGAAKCLVALPLTACVIMLGMHVT